MLAFTFLLNVSSFSCLVLNSSFKKRELIESLNVLAGTHVSIG